jgi:hypothetical protein
MFDPCEDGVQPSRHDPSDTDPWHGMDQLIDGLEAGLDPQHRVLYAPHFASERQLMGKIRRNAKPPERVAAAVERQLTRQRNAAAHPGGRGRPVDPRHEGAAPGPRPRRGLDSSHQGLKSTTNGYRC